MRMRKQLGSWIALVAVLAVAGLAHAGDGEHKFKLLSDVELQGKTLAAGKYEVSWSGSGDQVTVKFTRGKELVEEARATVVPLAEPSRFDTVLKGEDGKQLKEMRFAGESMALSFSGPSAQAAGGKGGAGKPSASDAGGAKPAASPAKP